MKYAPKLYPSTRAALEKAIYEYRVGHRNEFRAYGLDWRFENTELDISVPTAKQRHKITCTVLQQLERTSRNGYTADAFGMRVPLLLGLSPEKIHEAIGQHIVRHIMES